MPNICTHLIFGARVAEATQKPFASSDGMYALGCLGPDWYFYDRLPPTPFVPHKKKHGNATVFGCLLRCATLPTLPCVRICTGF